MAEESTFVESYHNLADRFMRMVWDETGFPIIICDDTGTIVNAIDAKRIGTVHAGSQKIMAGEADEYAATAEEAAKNPLVKEGYSCPIVVDGRRVGTFGITGDLNLTGPLARLSAVILARMIREIRQQDRVSRTARSVFSQIQEMQRKTGELDREFHSLIQEMKTAVADAAQEVRETRQILETIHKISQQSHILSINGSVEATRAGEHGRAFAIVAREMTRLARDTREAGEVIQTTLQRVRTGIDNVESAIHHSESLSEAHRNVMDEVARTIQSLADAVKDLEDGAPAIT